MCYSDTLMGSQCGLPVTMNLVGLMLIKIFLLLLFALQLTCLPCKANQPPWSWALPRTELQSINLKDLAVRIVVNASRP